MRVSPGGGSVSNGYIIPDLEGIRHEELLNSEEFITVIPTLVPDDATDDNRLLILRINREIRHILFSVYHDSNSSPELLTGIVVTREINGDFINAYRYKDGYVVAKLVPRKSNDLTKPGPRLVATDDYYWELGELPPFLFTFTKSSPNSMSVGGLFGGVEEGALEENKATYWIEREDYGGTPDPEEEGKKLANLFKTEYEKIKKQYQEMLSECVFEGVHDLLNARGKNIGSIVSMASLNIPNLRGNEEGVYTRNGDIGFRDPNDVWLSTFKHEYIHVFQHLIGGVQIHESVNTGMAEFEARVMYDMYTILTSSGTYSKLFNETDYMNSWMLTYIYGPGKEEVESHVGLRDSYIEWLNSLINATTESEVNQIFANGKYKNKGEDVSFISIFANHSPYSGGYNFNNNQYSYVSTLKFGEILNNCYDSNKK